MRVERRTEGRVSTWLPCRIHLACGTLMAQVIELSRAGARIELSIALPPTELWTLSGLEIDGRERIGARVVWNSGKIAGLAFARPNVTPAAEPERQ
jgi:hypothetical protein